ncbi:MAG: efflux RND transporter periplasmic adaptor subunit [Gammaproteobacteria bacterium]|nr:efflux RND transporter periplasmic adaptor subunit [Gammaproteobacteria bacterium]
MSTDNTSTSWYRIADTKPRLQGHITTHRHEYRNQAWFILYDTHLGRSHRFNATAWFFISCMNGHRTMAELYDIICTKFSNNPPTQDELISLLGKLYLSELISTDKVPDIDELSLRVKNSKKQRIKQYFLNPIAIRFNLINPDKLLGQSLRFITPLFRKKVFYAWLGLTALALMLAILNWPELSNATRLHAFSTSNIFIIILIYPIIKLLHELGHAYAIKHFGGEVNEMGIMMMAFIPIPYVNAHNAIAFPDKHQRILVSAMGIIIETSLASLALLVWLAIEPGLIRTICLDIILIGGLSTLLINGNPLLKFDGYHVMADAIESPNLASRSKKYLSFILHKALFNVIKIDNGLSTEKEAQLFLIYAISAFICRIFIMLFILGMLIDKFFAIGIFLAAWVITVQFILPGLKYIHYLTNSLEISQQRARVSIVVASVSLIILIAVFLIPVPHTSSTEGIIWLSEEMQIKSKAPGFIRQIHVSNNQEVLAGQTILRVEDPLLAGKVNVLKAMLREKDALLKAKRGQHLEEEQLKQEITALKSELDLNNDRLASLRITSPAAGRLIVPDIQDLPDQFVQAGQLIGFILDPAHITAQVIISEEEIALFNPETSVFEIRPVGQLDKLVTARFKRLVPEAIKYLPSAALGIKGGGKVLVDPDDPSGRKTVEKVFQLELYLPKNSIGNQIGSRVYVKIRHAYQPLAKQWGRRLQQLLLGRFNV